MHSNHKMGKAMGNLYCLSGLLVTLGSRQTGTELEDCCGAIPATVFPAIGTAEYMIALFLSSHVRSYLGSSVCHFRSSLGSLFGEILHSGMHEEQSLRGVDRGSARPRVPAVLLWCALVIK